MRKLVLALLVLAVIVVGLLMWCPDSGPTSAWIRPNDPPIAVRNDKGTACMLVSGDAVVGDSIKVTIAMLSANDSTPPDPLPSAFANAREEGRTIFPTFHDFEILGADGDTLHELADSITVAMCVYDVVGRDAILAHPDPMDPASLEEFVAISPPGACELVCEPHGGGRIRQARLPRDWLDGSLLTPTPARAALQWTQFRGLGGKGGGTSPVAAVGPVPVR